MNTPRPGIEKTEAFAKGFKHTLGSNEWQVKWPVQGLEWKTYNPDFYCPELDCYIEVCTSFGNYYESRKKWRQVIKAGRPLRVYWWQGWEITKAVLEDKMPREAVRRNGKLGGRPRTKKQVDTKRLCSQFPSVAE